jgi:hypothetical protein
MDYRRHLRVQKACEAERVHFSKVDPDAEVAGDMPPEEVYDV